MPRFAFNKLVRDKIVDHQHASGATPHYHILSAQRHKEELINKIIEEAREIAIAAPDKLAAEIADVQQAIDDLKEVIGLTTDDILAAQNTKNDKNGSFKRGVFIEYVEVKSNDEWADYYRKNADRYPEIK